MNQAEAMKALLDGERVKANVVGDPNQYFFLKNGRIWFQYEDERPVEAETFCNFTDFVKAPKSKDIETSIGDCYFALIHNLRNNHADAAAREIERLIELKIEYLSEKNK